VGTRADQQTDLSLGSRIVIARIDPPHSTVPDANLTFVKEISVALRDDLGRSELTHSNVHRLFQECKNLRDNLPAEDWKRCVRKIRESELLQLVHQDPFTSRAFNKPRGYAGDAVMMDYIYGAEEGWHPPETSPLGNDVFHYTSNAAASAGVRARREHIAEKLDEIAREKSAPHVLAVASGHLREASMSSAVRRCKIGRFVALDADGESLKEVDRCFGRYGVKCELADIRKMLTGQLNLGQFDLIYSTGLYDYLKEKTAQKLTQHLFAMLKPGGKLVIANFVPTIRDIGYMEACMDWFLVYRDRMQMMGLTNLIPQVELSRIQVHVEENQNIIFLEVTRT
jgi:extracellular factor (EF) 3-hydroxypalmitic acid methyl ester biosynthesis protein